MRVQTHNTLVIFFLLLLVNVKAEASSHGSHGDNSRKITSTEGLTDSLLMSPKLSFEIALHGLSLWASMGFLMPVGILIIRMSNREKCGQKLRILLSIHAGLQMLAILLSTAAAIISVKNFDNSFSNNHQRMGVFLYGAVWIQALIGLIRPQRATKGRITWFSVHWLYGTAVSLLGIINIYTGLQAYHKRTHKSIRLWSVLFTVEISLIAFIYLFQDKWEYMQSQGMSLGNELMRTAKENIPTRDIQKGKMLEPC